MNIVILRTKGTKFFSHSSGVDEKTKEHWRYWVLNLIPGKFGVYFQVGTYPM